MLLLLVFFFGTLKSLWCRVIQWYLKKKQYNNKNMTSIKTVLNNRRRLKNRTVAVTEKKVKTFLHSISIQQHRNGKNNCAQKCNIIQIGNTFSNCLQFYHNKWWNVNNNCKSIDWDFRTWNIFGALWRPQSNWMQLKTPTTTKKIEIVVNH